MRFSAIPLNLASLVAASSLTTLHTFPNFTFLENIAIRSNSDLLLTTLSSASVYTFSPKSNTSSPSLLATFPAPLNGVSGITEYAPDRFAVSVAQMDLLQRRGTGFEIWSIDTRTSPAQTSKIVSFPGVAAFNGLTPLPFRPGSILAAESDGGSVYRIDVISRSYTKVIEVPEMKAPGPAPDLGINGLHIHAGYLYFVNSSGGHFTRVRIHANGTKAGNVEILTRFGDGQGWDDFAIDEQGRSWVASHPHEIFKVSERRHRWLTETIAVTGPETDIGPTSAAFGRGKGQQDYLYIVSGDGKILRLNTRGM